MRAWWKGAPPPTVTGWSPRGAIRGGARSPAGTDAEMALAALLGTRAARGPDPHRECLPMLGPPRA